MFHFIFFLLTSWGVVSCQLDESTNAPTAVTTIDYQVYSGFLNTLNLFGKNSANTMVILYNQIPRQLQAKLNVRYPVQVCSRQQLLAMSEAGSLANKQYYIIGFSNIMYNTAQTRAIFFSSSTCGGTCGSGELILMENVNETWTLVDTFRFWIA